MLDANQAQKCIIWSGSSGYGDCLAVLLELMSVSVHNLLLFLYKSRRNFHLGGSGRLTKFARYDAYNSYLKLGTVLDFCCRSTLFK